jgi:uncharacterized membrane protein (UPF0127 family)
MTMHVAQTFGARFLGWMGRRRLAPGDALWLRPCRAVHTLGMRLPIDVVFLDRGGCVLRVVASLPPWRACAHRHAYAVLELPAGAAAARGLQPGVRVDLPWRSPEAREAGRWSRVRRTGMAVGVVVVLAIAWRAGPARAAAPLIDDPALPDAPPVAIVFETEWTPDARRLVEEAVPPDGQRGPARAVTSRWPFSGAGAPPAVPTGLPPGGSPLASPSSAAVALAAPVRAPAVMIAHATNHPVPPTTTLVTSPAAGCGSPSTALPPVALLRPLSPDTLARALEEADGLYHAKHWARALEAFCGLVEIDPANRLAWLRIGNLQHQRNRLPHAAEAYRQAARATDASDTTEPTPMRARALANLAAVALEQARESLVELRQLNLPPQASAMQLAEQIGVELRALGAEAPRPAAAARTGVEILGSRPGRVHEPAR